MAEYIKKADVLEYLSARRNQVLKSPLSTLDAKFEVMEIFDFVDHRVESADVAPLRHGRWLDGKCTVCGWKEPDVGTWDGYDAEAWIETPYCPNCGAIMDGGIL